jgi:hypothetical protein
MNQVHCGKAVACPEGSLRLRDEQALARVDSFLSTTRGLQSSRSAGTFPRSACRRGGSSHCQRILAFIATMPCPKLARSCLSTIPEGAEQDLGQGGRIAHACGLLLARSISDTTVAKALARCCIPASTGGMGAARAASVVAAACHENTDGGDAKHNTKKAYARQVNLHAHQSNAWPYTCKLHRLVDANPKLTPRRRKREQFECMHRLLLG